MEIKNFKQINSGCLKCSFSVVIPEWGGTEVDCTYFEKVSDKGDQCWINFAPREYMTKEGKKKSWNQVRWPQAVLEKLSAAIKAAIRPMLDPEFNLSNEPPMAEEDLPF
jgi:hypothetical protein